MSEHLIVCGGPSSGRRVGKNVVHLSVDAPKGSPARVNLKFSDISKRMVETVPAVLADLSSERKLSVSPFVASRQRHLVSALRQRTRSNSLFHVPIVVNNGQEEALDTNQRARSFLFATLGLVIARLFRRNKILFFENGIVSVNLPVAGHVLGTRATRTTHPKVLADLQRLFSLLLNETVVVDNPHFWKTKADVVNTIAQHECADLIGESFSCTRVRGARADARHCGLCSQCIDRRLGVLAAGLAPHDPEDGYRVELFRGEREPGTDITMAESYVMHAMRLASMSETAFFSNFGQVFRVLRSLPGSVEENAQKLHALHRRHGQSVADVIDGELKRHATLAGALAIPENSLMMMIQSSTVRFPDTLDATENEPLASEQATNRGAGIPKAHGPDRPGAPVASITAHARTLALVGPRPSFPQNRRAGRVSPLGRRGLRSAAIAH